MDNTIDNISIFKEDNIFQFEEDLAKVNKKENNNKNSPKNITENEFDFEKSLELSGISPDKDEIKQKTEKEKNNSNLNLSLDYSFINQNINILDMKNNLNDNDSDIKKNNIRKTKTMPIKKIKKEDLDKIPLPIFSCIYCSNEYLSFNHLSNEIISNKYLLQTSKMDVKQLDFLISSQTKIYKDNVNNKLLNLVINNSEYLKKFYTTDKIEEYFKLNMFISKCQNSQLMIKRILKERLEDIIIRKKKDFYFKETKGINKIPKTSINNKCLFNSTNSLINNYSALNGFIGNGPLIPHIQLEKNNNSNQSNSSLSYFNLISVNNNKNEIGLIGKGNNRHYMENIPENTNKNIEGENTIEEKNEFLDFFEENDLKRKINKNDIEWENGYYDVYNPIINDDILETSFGKDEFEKIKSKKNEIKNNNKFQIIDSNKKTNLSNVINNKNLAILNNSKSLASTNTSSNIILKNSVRDKENKSSLSFLLNGNNIVNIQNNNSTIGPGNFNINIKKKLNSIDSKNKDGKNKLTNFNRTPSFTKTRIIDLSSKSDKKLNINNRKSSIDLKNIHKKILFNYTANIKKEIFLDNNMALKIKSAFHNNKRNHIINNKNLFPIKNSNASNTESKIINKKNKYNILLAKPNINNDNIYNKTLFNKTANALKPDKDNKKSNYNFNLLYIKNNFDYGAYKRQIYNNKQVSILNKNKLVNINNFDNVKYFNNIKSEEQNFNMRSLEKDIDRRKKIYNIRNNYKSAKKVNISIPQKLLYGNINTQEIQKKDSSKISKSLRENYYIFKKKMN